MKSMKEITNLYFGAIPISFCFSLIGVAGFYMFYLLVRLVGTTIDLNVFENSLLIFIIGLLLIPLVMVISYIQETRNYHLCGSRFCREIKVAIDANSEVSIKKIFYELETKKFPIKICSLENNKGEIRFLRSDYSNVSKDFFSRVEPERNLSIEIINNKYICTLTPVSSFVPTTACASSLPLMEAISKIISQM